MPYMPLVKIIRGGMLSGKILSCLYWRRKRGPAGQQAAIAYLPRRTSGEGADMAWRRRPAYKSPRAWRAASQAYDSAKSRVGGKYLMRTRIRTALVAAT